MRFPEIQQLWKMTKTAISICSFLLLFFVGMELLRAYQTFYSVHPMLGGFFVIAAFALIIWFLFWLFQSFASLPKVLTPPKIRDFDNLTMKEAREYCDYLVKYLMRLSQNGNLTEEHRLSVQKYLDDLSKAIKGKPSSEELLRHIHLMESGAIVPALEILKKKSEGEVWSSVRNIGIGVAVSPFHALDLVLVIYGNIKMTVRIMEVYQGRPSLLEIMRTLRDVGSVLVTVSFLNISEKVIEKLFSLVPGVGRIVDEIAQGCGAALMTSVAGNAAIHRCSAFNRRWKPEDASGEIKGKIGNLHRLVGDLIRDEMIPKLRKLKHDAAGKENAEQNAFWENLSNKVTEAFEETKEFATSCVHVSKSVGFGVQQRTVKTARVVRKTMLNVVRSVPQAVRMSAASVKKAGVKVKGVSSSSAKRTQMLFGKMKVLGQRIIHRNGKRANGKLKKPTIINKGFTLVEIMVVTGIVGLLAVTSFPMFNRIYQDVDAVKVEAELNSIDAAITIYFAEKGTYPTDITELQDYVGIANIAEHYELNPNL